MELRGEDSFSAHVKEAFSNHIKRTKKIDINNFKYVFQPAGLDNMHDIEKQKAANKLYSRILINHVKGEKGDFAEYDCDISFSVEEYKELNQTFKENLRNEAALAQGVFSLKIIKIGNIVVAKNKHKFAYIKQEYLRSGLNGDVEVIDYYIFNNDEMVKLTTSFRVSERKLWEKDFEKIINTFSFNTKK